MVWKVEIHDKVAKELKKLPYKTLSTVQWLIEDLCHHGPYPGMGWANYGKLIQGLGVDRRHCHIVKGRPTYVACWEVINKVEKIMEIYYVGTHENAPY